MAKKTGLGQGVSLLFNEEEERFFECNVEKIKPNKHQPRDQFKLKDLEELASSIKENGVIQPLVVSDTKNGFYELIAGERRLRASKLAGLSTVPVITMEISDDDSMLELALIENIQRTDLNPIEEAKAYKKLIEKFNYTQEETSKRVGKKRSTITNMLRLLKLPKSIQLDISNGLITEGHGRALIRIIDDPLRMKEIRDSIVNNGLSVRQTERIIKKKSPVTTGQIKRVNKNDNEIPESYQKSLINQLTNKLHSKVSITQNGSRGKIEIEYYSFDDLERVFSLLLND